MTGYAFSVGVCVALVLLILVLLRKRRLREKYAGLWIALGLAVSLLALFPDVAFWLASIAGVQTPVNLIFSLALLVLLALVIQLSAELSTVEDETRVLAEEVALLRLDLSEVARTPHEAGPAPEPEVE